MSGWSAIVGKPGTEKGQAARKLAALLEARGLAVTGFVQDDVSDPEGKTVGWDISSVTGPTQRGILAREAAEADLCGYKFEASGFALAERLSQGAADVVIVGGVGKLEAAEQGHWPLLKSLIEREPGAHVVACIRDTCLSAVALALPDPLDYVELPCDDAELERLAERLAAEVAGH
jgi:nucleoside-triphosphatase THEP1